MPLIIDLKSHDKLIINGAVVENGGPNTKLIVHNEAALLRQKEILNEEEACTPATRVYFALQCAYIFPEHQGQYLQQYRDLLDQYLEAAPSAQDLADRIEDEVRAGSLYKALRQAHALVLHQRDVLQQFESSVANRLEEDTPEDS